MGASERPATLDDVVAVLQRIEQKLDAPPWVASVVGVMERIEQKVRRQVPWAFTYRVDDVMELTGLRRSEVYRLVREGVLEKVPAELLGRGALTGLSKTVLVKRASLRKVFGELTGGQS